MTHLAICVSVGVSPLIFPRQRQGKYIPEEVNAHATIEELLVVSFSMRSVPYERTIGD
jgi:hypothetical protein